MTWPVKRLSHLLALALGIVPAASAQAQMPLFLDTCVAEAGDLDRLPLAFAKAGPVEVDRAAGPLGPAIAALVPDRRMWSAPGGSGMGEVFAGYSPLGDTLFAVCWTVSRPGLSAADMLVELKRRFPPDHGATSRGTEAFYGGSETWAAEVRGSQVIVGVNWPVRQSPDQGTGLIYLAKPRQQGAWPPARRPTLAAPRATPSSP